LYCTLSREGTVIKIDLVSGKIVKSAYIGREARSMCLSPDGTHLYAVAYEDNRLVKLATADLTKVAVEPTRQQPIGITCDPETGAVWVACYSGSIMVFEDTRPTLAYAPVPVAPAPETQSLRYVPGNLIPNPGPVFYERQAQPTSRSADTPALISRKYYIVIGSYARLENARIIYNKLKAKGLEPEIISGENNWRVSLSRHTSYEEAAEALTKAKQQYNTECWILTR
jgi:hypothetical protein